MNQARLVPVLLVSDGALVKTRRFANPVYLGDPINAVRIFNEKAVDELMILDISATPSRRGPDFDLVASISEEAFVPVTYGGGITTRGHAARLLNQGVDKVVINSASHTDRLLIGEIAADFGAQAVCASIDVDRGRNGEAIVVSAGGRRHHTVKLNDWAKQLVEAGAGEILLQSVERDGSMAGYDQALIRSISQSIPVPLVACGGASGLQDMVDAVVHGGASAVGAGALFVFYGPHRAVLINPPSQQQFAEALAAARPASEA